MVEDIKNQMIESIEKLECGHKVSKEDCENLKKYFLNIDIENEDLFSNPLAFLGVLMTIIGLGGNNNEL